MHRLSKGELKHLTSLKQKKYRQKTHQCLLEGARLCKEALASSWSIESIYMTEDFLAQPVSETFIVQGEIRSIPIKQTTARELQRASDTQSSQGVAILVTLPAVQPARVPESSNSVVLLLDGISDPGNLGTLVRSADWF